MQFRLWIAAVLLAMAAAAAWAVPVGTPSAQEAAASNPPGKKTEFMPVEPIPAKTPDTDSGNVQAQAPGPPPSKAPETPVEKRPGPAGAVAKAHEEPPRAPSSPAPVYAAPRIDLSQRFPAWAQAEVAGNALWQFLAALAFLLAGFVAKKVSDIVLSRHIARMSARKGPDERPLVLAQSLSKPLGFLLFLAGLAGAAGVLSLPEKPVNAERFAYSALKVLLVADLLWFLFRAVDLGVAHLARAADERESKLDDKMVPLVRQCVKAALAVVCAVWVVQLLGYDVSSLIAGLGIGGLAVALALQDTLANFFGSIVIFLDRPFRLGEHVRIGDVEGTVEQVGFRSTRVRTWPETLVSIPNKTVASVTIDNLSRMPNRRVLQTVGLALKTTPDEVEKAVAALRDLVAADEGVAQTGLVVRFTDFTATSFGLTVQYFTRATDYTGHLATKERINLAILRKLAEMGVSVA